MSARALRQGLSVALLLVGLGGGLALLLSADQGRAAQLPAAAPASTAAGPSSPPVATLPSASISAPTPAPTSPASSPSASSAAASAVIPAAPSAAPASASASASASATATAPARSASAGGAQAWPVRPATHIAALHLPPRPACQPDPAQPERCGPLTLERNPVTLSGGQPGRAYNRLLQAEGGVPPYRFEVVEGQLPRGLTLGTQGLISGSPEQAGASDFRVRVRDSVGDAASQRYSLRVWVPAAKPAASAASAPAQAASAPLLSQLDLSQADTTPSENPSFRVYQLPAWAPDGLLPLLQPPPPPPAELASDSAALPPETEPAQAGTHANANAAMPPLPPLPPQPPLPPLPPLPTDLRWTRAQQTQLALLLKPVFNVAYPTRWLFEAAVDARVCAHAWGLIVREAQRLKQQTPSEAEFARQCSAAGAKARPSAAPHSPQAAAPEAPASPAAPASPSATAAPNTSPPSGSARASDLASEAASEAALPVAWRDLPAWLMPPSLRVWLAKAAAKDQPLLPDPPPPWVPVDRCNCATQRLQHQLFAIYPAWHARPPAAQDAAQPASTPARPQAASAPAPEQALDFSLINRITLLGLPLNDDQALAQIGHWDRAQTAFIRTARDHDTRVDFGIHNADWRFLATEPEAARNAHLRRLLTETPVRVRELLNTRLPGWVSAAKSWLPGFAEVQYMGDGVTVFFDQLPDPHTEPVLAARFAEFYPRFIKGLASELDNKSTRTYAINLVMNEQQIADPTGPFDAGRLFELLKIVEKPVMANGHIVERNGDYKRNTNIQLRMLVLLSEPTAHSKERLRNALEASPALKGGDLRAMLRSVVPVLMLPQASMAQYVDDVVYLQDNFGGAGFWPAPSIGPQFTAEQQKTLHDNFDPPVMAAVASDALCRLVCPHRWAFRLAFELLLLLCALCWALLHWNCEWRARYGRYALLGGISPLLVGAALLQCDPQLQWLRDGNAQLIALIAIPLLAALGAALKRQEDKP